MKLFWLVPSLFTSLAFGRPSCRCMYGEQCWPNASDFSQLASQLSQPLIHPVPPESACYPASNPSGNCTDVLQGARNGNWRADQSGSTQIPNFETFTFRNGTISACYLNTTLGVPCEQGSVPVVGVDARLVEDIQAAVKFASKHHLRLVVKNTGHDFLGRSTSRGSFLMWTHHLKNITYNETFVPDGAPSSEIYNAITLGAGVQWHEAYDAIQAKGRFVVGGLSAGASVGATGGWILGGGHSAFSPRHGLGVDNVIQFGIVTAAVDYLTVNSHNHPDLFWALRGGGGGSYGIITYATYRTHESVPLTGTFLVANFSSPETAKTVVTEFMRIQPSLADAGWGGYGFFSSESLLFFYVAPNISWAETNNTIDPFFSFVQNATAGGPPTVAFTSPFDSFYSWYKEFFSTGEQVGTNLEMGSRLIPRDLFETDYTKVADTVLAVTGGVAWQYVQTVALNTIYDADLLFSVLSLGAVSKVDPESTGLNPAWRKALAHVVFAETWPEGSTTSYIKDVTDRVKINIAKFEQLSPDLGAYYNEASLHEKNPQHTFFGSHYRKLKTIKDVYDPQGLFVVADGVGSEDWDASLNCRR